LGLGGQLSGWSDIGRRSAAARPIDWAVEDQNFFVVRAVGIEPTLLAEPDFDLAPKKG